MIRIVMALLIVMCAIVIIGSFFMPWAKAVTTASKVATGIKEAVEGRFKGSPLAEKFVAKMDKAAETINEFGDVRFKTLVCGYEIPVLVNRRSSKAALSLIRVFTPKADGPGKEVLLIYLIPILAIVCIVSAFLGLRNDIFIVLIGAVSGVISIAGLYKIMTADISNSMVQISIERGLWQTLYGYLLMFVLSVVWFVWNSFSGGSKQD